MEFYNFGALKTEQAHCKLMRLFKSFDLVNLVEWDEVFLWPKGSVSGQFDSIK